MIQYKKAVRFLASMNTGLDKATDLPQLTEQGCVQAVAIVVGKLPLQVANDILRITMNPEKKAAVKKEFWTDEFSEVWAGPLSKD